MPACSRCLVFQNQEERERPRKKHEHQIVEDISRMKREIETVRARWTKPSTELICSRERKEE